MIDQTLFPNPLQIGGARPAGRTRPAADGGRGPADSTFARTLEEKLPSQGVRFSQHAQERLKERNINLSATDMAKLSGAVDTVAGKGGKESLIMVGDAALVVSIRNRTVITAMPRGQMQGNVVTNIDSAVVL